MGANKERFILVGKGGVGGAAVHVVHDHLHGLTAWIQQYDNSIIALEDSAYRALIAREFLRLYPDEIPQEHAYKIISMLYNVPVEAVKMIDHFNDMTKNPAEFHAALAAYKE